MQATNQTIPCSTAVTSPSHTKICGKSLLFAIAVQTISVEAGSFYGQGLHKAEGEKSGFAVIESAPDFGRQTTSIRYIWDGTMERYVVDLSVLGDPITWQNANEAFTGKEEFLQTVLERSLGNQYLFMTGASSADDEVLIGGADLNGDEEPEYFLQVRAVTVCDDDGCPVFIFRDLNEPHFARMISGGRSVVVADTRKEDELKATRSVCLDPPVDVV
ncbi:MAG: hypothetical protein ACU0AZ_11955 [Paracoccaceae bacterium]